MFCHLAAGLSPADWNLTEGERKFCRVLTEKLLFYSHSRKEAKRPGGHIWECVLEPEKPVRKGGLGKRKCPSLLLLFSFLFVMEQREERKGRAKVLNRWEMGHLFHTYQDPETRWELYWGWVNLLLSAQLCTLGKPRESAWVDSMFLVNCWSTLRRKAIWAVETWSHRHLVRERGKVPTRCTFDSNHKWGHPKDFQT